MPGRGISATVEMVRYGTGATNGHRSDDEDLP